MIYLDNAATTFPKPANVIDAASAAITEGIGTPGRGSHSSAFKAGTAAAAARKNMAGFFGSTDERRAVFAYSATDALNLAIKGFLDKGDKVVITAAEHNSVSRPLIGMARDGFIDLEIADCDDKGYVDKDDLRSKTTPGTRLVAVCHASNVTGAVQPVDEIGLIARENGAYLLLDAAQSAGRLPIDISAMPVDFVAFAGHKGLYGLQGTGGLVIGDRVRKLRPFREGGTGFDSRSETQPAAWPEAFEAGTHNVPGIISLNEGIRFLKETGVEKIAAAEKELFDKIWEFLAGTDSVILYGPRPDEARIAVLSFNIRGWDPGDVGEILDKNYGIETRTGLHCSPLAHKRLGTFPAGAVRVSPGYFNGREDLNIFFEAIKRIASTDVPVY